MKREEAQAVIEAVHDIDRMLETVPHGTAKMIMIATKEIADIVGEEFPGGYYGICIGCDEPKGEEEMQSAGDEDLCTECIKDAIEAGHFEENVDEG